MDKQCWQAVEDKAGNSSGNCERSLVLDKGHKRLGFILLKGEVRRRLVFFFFYGSQQGLDEADTLERVLWQWCLRYNGKSKRVLEGEKASYGAATEMKQEERLGVEGLKEKKWRDFHNSSTSRYHPCILHLQAEVTGANSLWWWLFLNRPLSQGCLVRNPVLAMHEQLLAWEIFVSLSDCG